MEGVGCLLQEIDFLIERSICLTVEIDIYYFLIYLLFPYPYM